MNRSKPKNPIEYAATIGCSLLLAASLGPWAGAEELPFPHRIDMFDPANPYFMSAELAESLPESDPAYESVQASLKHVKSQPDSSDCVPLTWTNSGHRPPWGDPSLGELIDRADHVILAVAGENRGGFQHGHEPGQLLRLRFERSLKGELKAKEAFSFFPAGTFEMLGRRYCMTSYGMPTPPPQGGRILLFFRERHWKPEISVLYIGSIHFVTLPESGAVEKSPYLKVDDLVEKAELKHKLQSSELVRWIEHRTNGAGQPEEKRP